MRTPPTCRRRRSSARRMRCARSRAAIPGHYAEPPARTNVKLYGDDSPLAAPSFEAKAQLLQTIDAYARAKDPRVRQVTASIAATLAGGRDFARRRRNLSRRAAAGARVRLRRGRRRRSSGNRQRRLWRPRRLRALPRHQCLAGRGRQRHPPSFGQSRSGAGARRRDGRRARSGLARRHAARGGRSRPRRRLQPQEDIGFCRTDGATGRRQGRHRGRRRHHGSCAAARCRSTTKAPRPTAPC